MALSPPKALILGHSFVKRLQRALEGAFDSRASVDFHLNGMAVVGFHGFGGQTVQTPHGWGGTPCNGLYGEAPPKWVPFSGQE